MTTSYPWPVPPGTSCQPVWTGSGFQIGRESTSILTFNPGRSGWTDQLTEFHEDNAGPDHFIDRASRNHAVAQIKRYASGAAPIILEVGCSSGFLLQDLQRALPNALLIGSDCVRGPLENLAQRLPGVPLLQFDMVDCPLPSDSVDVVVLLNVLEHIADHGGAVRHIHRILKPGGVAVIEVPAGPHLYDVYDKLLLHHRRYTLSGLRELLDNAGLSVVHASGLGALVYPGFWFVKRRNRRYLTASEAVQKAVVARSIRKTARNHLLEGLMWLEDRLRPLLPLPFGIRCLATCVKSSVRNSRAA
jgi:SAM-dependent methyltransferase